MATSGSRLLSSNRAGWSMAAPAIGLILLFIIVPFALAFGLSGASRWQAFRYVTWPGLRAQPKIKLSDFSLL